MYNLGMKNIQIRANKWMGKYKYNAILTLTIFILFFCLGYSSKNIKYKLYVEGNEIKLTHGICNINNEQYMHIDDLISVFSDEIYHDKISGNVIITTYDSVKRIDKTDSLYVQKLEDDIYFNLGRIVEELSCEMIVSNNDIYIADYTYVQAMVKNNRTELLDSNNSKTIAFLEKTESVKIVENNLISSNDSRVVNVVATKGDKRFFGYVLKENLQYKYNKDNEVNQSEKIILVKADDTLSTTTDINNIDIVAMNMYRLSGVNVLSRLEFTNNIHGNVNVYATFNNGQTSSNYDPEITTRMLNSEANREQIIQQLIDGTEKLQGVNLEFGNLKNTDKQNFTQFVKELAANLHASGKKLIVTLANIQYVEVDKILKVVDYVVIKPYTARTTASKTSGPISSISHVENTIKNLLKQQVILDKIIIEIPAYSILWTERKGTVINAEKYSMQMIQQYINANNIESVLDKVSGQNYINYSKGITTYKMWLEDIHSIREKTKLVNKYNLSGISVYQSGMELKEIYKEISKTLIN